MKKIALFWLLFSALHASSTSQIAKPFVIGKLMGQFGNQFFVIATTVSLALDHDARPVFPDFFAPPDPSLNLTLNYKKVFYHLDASAPTDAVEYRYDEPAFSYAPIPYRPNMVLKGWFQSEKYFRHHKTEILSLFAPHPELLHYLTQKYGHVIQHPKTVSIHVRSYQKEDPYSLVYANIEMDYYKKAMSLFPEDSLFVVFSNNISWCKEHFASISREILFIEGEAHYHDFYLMSLCKDNIICNSSFSWWAAYLNQNAYKKVIVPARWFNPAYIHATPDLIPDGWTIL